MLPEALAQVCAAALRQFGCTAEILPPHDMTDPARYLGVTTPGGDQISISINYTE